MITKKLQSSFTKYIQPYCIKGTIRGGIERSSYTEAWYFAPEPTPNLIMMECGPEM